MKIIHRGCEGHSASPDEFLMCPHCGYTYQDAVRDFCVVGNPNKSKEECCDCYNPFAVIVKENVFYVLKLIRLNDNIN